MMMHSRGLQSEKSDTVRKLVGVCVSVCVCVCVFLHTYPDLLRGAEWH